MWREDLQVYRLTVDSLVISRYSRGFVLNLLLYMCKIGVFPPRLMVKFSPLSVLLDTAGSVWFIFVITVRGNVDELEDQGPSSNNATSSG